MRLGPRRWLALEKIGFRALSGGRLGTVREELNEVQFVDGEGWQAVEEIARRAGVRRERAISCGLRVGVGELLNEGELREAVELLRVVKTSGEGGNGVFRALRSVCFAFGRVGDLRSGLELARSFGDGAAVDAVVRGGAIGKVDGPVWERGFLRLLYGRKSGGLKDLDEKLLWDTCVERLTGDGVRTESWENVLRVMGNVERGVWTEGVNRLEKMLYGEEEKKMGRSVFFGGEAKSDATKKSVGFLGEAQSETTIKSERSFELSDALKLPWPPMEWRGGEPRLKREGVWRHWEREVGGIPQPFPLPKPKLGRYSPSRAFPKVEEEEEEEEEGGFGAVPRELLLSMNHPSVEIAGKQGKLPLWPSIRRLVDATQLRNPTKTQSTIPLSLRVKVDKDDISLDALFRENRQLKEDEEGVVVEEEEEGASLQKIPFSGGSPPQNTPKVPFSGGSLPQNTPRVPRLEWERNGGGLRGLEEFGSLEMKGVAKVLRVWDGMDGKAVTGKGIALAVQSCRDAKEVLLLRRACLLHSNALRRAALSPVATEAFVMGCVVHGGAQAAMSVLEDVMESGAMFGNAPGLMLRALATQGAHVLVVNTAQWMMQEGIQLNDRILTNIVMRSAAYLHEVPFFGGSPPQNTQEVPFSGGSPPQNTQEVPFSGASPPQNTAFAALLQYIQSHPRPKRLEGAAVNLGLTGQCSQILQLLRDFEQQEEKGATTQKQYFEDEEEETAKKQYFEGEEQEEESAKKGVVRGVVRGLCVGGRPDLGLEVALEVGVDKVGVGALLCIARAVQSREDLEIAFEAVRCAAQLGAGREAMRNVLVRALDASYASQTPLPPSLASVFPPPGYETLPSVLPAVSSSADLVRIGRGVLLSTLVDAAVDTFGGNEDATPEKQGLFFGGDGPKDDQTPSKQAETSSKHIFFGGDDDDEEEDDDDDETRSKSPSISKESSFFAESAREVLGLIPLPWGWHRPSSKTGGSVAEVRQGHLNGLDAELATVGSPAFARFRAAVTASEFSAFERACVVAENAVRSDPRLEASLRKKYGGTSPIPPFPAAAFGRFAESKETFPIGEQLTNRRLAVPKPRPNTPSSQPSPQNTSIETWFAHDATARQSAADEAAKWGALDELSQRWKTNLESDQPSMFQTEPNPSKLEQVLRFLNLASHSAPTKHHISKPDYDPIEEAFRASETPSEHLNQASEVDFARAASLAAAISTTKQPSSPSSHRLRHYEVLDAASLRPRPTRRKRSTRTRAKPAIPQDVIDKYEQIAQRVDTERSN